MPTKVTDDQIIAAIHKAKGVRVKAANELGLHERSLLARLKRIKSKGHSIPESTYQPGHEVVNKGDYEFTPLPDDDVPIEELIEQRKRKFAHKREHEEASKLIPVRVKLDGPIGILHFDSGFGLHAPGGTACSAALRDQQPAGPSAAQVAQTAASVPASAGSACLGGHAAACPWRTSTGRRETGCPSPQPAGCIPGWLGLPGTPDRWRRTANRCSAASASNIQSYMNRVAVQLVRGSDRPDIIVAGNNYYRFYLESLQAIQRISSESSAGAGFTHFSATSLYKSSTRCSSLSMASRKDVPPFL